MTVFVCLNPNCFTALGANKHTEALSKVKKSEDDEDGEISEPEDPMMLARDAKDWKVRLN
jgi:hypothetical protein